MPDMWQPDGPSAASSGNPLGSVRNKLNVYLTGKLITKAVLSEEAYSDPGYTTSVLSLTDALSMTFKYDAKSVNSAWAASFKAASTNWYDA